MLFEAPKQLVKRLAAVEGMANGEPMLRIVWHDGKRCFVVQRQARNFRRGRGWVNVLDVTAQFRAGGPTDLGSGDRIVSELRRRDDHAKFRDFDQMWSREFEQHYRDVASRDAAEDDQFEVELVHDMEAAQREPHTVPPTKGRVRSFDPDNAGRWNDVAHEQPTC